MRTKKTAKNLVISLVLTTLVAIIGLFKIKVFDESKNLIKKYYI